MAERVENQDAQAAHEPLGTQLVRRGVITSEQLVVALEEQRRSGAQLGAILVAHGFATPALVAQALATQHGSLLKTEYGFAMGFGSGVEPPAVIDTPPVSLHVARAGADVTTATAPPAADPEADRGAVRSELELASSETARLSEANERLVALRGELEQRLAGESQRVAALERELAKLRATPPAGEDVAVWQEAHAKVEHARGQWQAAYAELEQRFVQASGQIASLEEDVSARAASFEELRASASKCESVRNELERGMAGEVRRGLMLNEELATARQRLVAAESAEAIRGELEARLEQVVARAAALEAQVVAGQELRASVAASEDARASLELRLEQAAGQLREAEKVRGELETRLGAAAERAAGLEAEAAEADELRRSALASKLAAGELERNLVAARAELEQRTAELEAARVAVPADPWAHAHAHLVFFQRPEGYQLVERAGPPPRVGSPVELPDLPTQTVARVARSPFPGDTLPCAYLVAA